MKKFLIIFVTVVSLSLLPLMAMAQSGDNNHGQQADKQEMTKESQQDKPALSRQQIKHLKKVTKPKNLKPITKPLNSDGRPHVRLSQEEVMLNNLATEAVNNNDYLKAEHLFGAMLQLKESNIIWYQLGRTYIKQNKCMEAKEAFVNAQTAPILDSEGVSERFVARIIETQLAEVDKLCRAKIRFQCIPGDMELSIDEGKAFKCQEHTVVSVVPGKHHISGKTESNLVQTTVDAESDKITDVTIK